MNEPDARGGDVPGASLPPPAGVDQHAADRETLAQPQRQARLAPVVLVLQGVRQLSILNIAFVGFAVTRFSEWLWLAPFVILAVVALAVASWWRYTFRVEGDDLIIDKGIISRERKTIPLARVQSVSIEQGIVNRVLGLVEAKIDTAGSAQAELVLEAVSRSTAESLRRLTTRTATSSSHLLGEHDSDGPPAPPQPGVPRAEQGERVLLHRTVGELARVALASNPLAGLGGIVGAIVLFGSELPEFFELEDRAEGAFGALRSSTPLIIGFIVAAIVIALVASFLATVVPLHDLTLYRSGDGLRSTSGLLSRRERVSSIERVQLASFNRNPVEQALGIWTVRLPSAGTRSDAAGGVIRLPGTTDDECEAIMNELGSERLKRPLPNAISSHAVARWTLWAGVLPAVIAGVALWTVVGWWAALTVLWVGVAAVSARANQRRWRWAITPDNIEIDRGVVVSQQATMAVRKVQAVRVTQTWFHRRRDLASLDIGTAAGNVRIPHIARDTAQQVRDELLLRAETDPRPFM